MGAEVNIFFIASTQKCVIQLNARADARFVSDSWISCSASARKCGGVTRWRCHSVCLFVRFFVSQSSVKLVKSFARWQHMAASFGLLCVWVCSVMTCRKLRSERPGAGTSLDQAAYLVVRRRSRPHHGVRRKCRRRQHRLPTAVGDRK